MTDDDRADLLGHDLREYMLRIVPTLESDVYAFTVWMSWDGALALNVGTEGGFERLRDLPAYRKVPEDQLRSPAGPRWNSGDWEVVAADFMSAEAERAMRPLFQAMRGDSAKLTPAAAANRILLIGVEGLRKMGTLPELRAANPAIAFVEPTTFRWWNGLRFLRASCPRRSCDHFFRTGNGWLIVSATFAPIPPRSLSCTASWNCPVSSVHGSRVGPNRPLIP